MPLDGSTAPRYRLRMPKKPSAKATPKAPKRPQKERVSEILDTLDRLIWPQLIIIGGGVSAEADKFLPHIRVRPRVVPATLQNAAGTAGAALYAAEHFAAIP